MTLAPQVGLEPTTLRLTAACSTDWAIEEYLKGELRQTDPRNAKPYEVVTRRRVELLFAAWEAAVLTTWPTGRHHKKIQKTDESFVSIYLSYRFVKWQFLRRCISQAMCIYQASVCDFLRSWCRNEASVLYKRILVIVLNNPKIYPESMYRHHWYTFRDSNPGHPD